MVSGVGFQHNVAEISQNQLSDTESQRAREPESQRAREPDSNIGLPTIEYFLFKVPFSTQTPP